MLSVATWLVSLDNPALDAFTAYVNDEERRRAARMIRGGERWLRSRGTLRRVLSGETGIPPEQITFRLTYRGKPSVERLEFSLSHSGAYALIATSAAPVGVDIERVRMDIDWAAIGRRFLHAPDLASEAEFFSLWTEREAYVKATGEGIAGNLASPAPAGSCVLTVAAPSGYVAALAVLAPEIHLIQREVYP